MDDKSTRWNVVDIYIILYQKVLIEKGALFRRKNIKNKSFILLYILSPGYTTEMVVSFKGIFSSKFCALSYETYLLF